MTLIKLTPEQTRQYLAYQRHVLRKLRLGKEYTRNPSAVQQYIDFARLSIICAKRGYMLRLSPGQPEPAEK